MTMNTFTRRLALLGAGIALGTAAWAQGLVVNEFSNGPTGNQEYYEYVVVGPSGSPNCGPIDIRGWIIDDNNGDFSCGPVQNVGIAQGHVRFANNLNWAAVPTGAIILVYNDADRNPAISLPDDPTDANLDLVYVVPISSALFDKTSGNNTCPVALNDQIPMACDTLCSAPTGTSAYTPVVYSAGGSWIQISMANAADASQTRLPGGAYFHGVAYGSATLMNGGPDNLHFTGSGSARCYSLTNGTSTDFRNFLNWTRGNAPGNETPGIGNTVANSAWIASLQVICPLPVTYAEPLTAVAEDEGNVLKWSTATETNTSHYEVLRSESIHGDFTNIGNLEAAYNSREKKDYEFLDAAPLRNAFYRLAQVDATGVMTYSNTVEVFRGSIQETALRFWPHPTADVLNFEVKGTGLNRVVLYDALGRVVQEMVVADGITVVQGEFDLRDLQAGVFILEASSSQGAARQKIVHVR